MVMHYLVQQNDTYMERLDDFEKRVDEIMDLMTIIKYNVEELQATVKALRITDAEDLKLKEKFNGQRY